MHRPHGTWASSIYDSIASRCPIESTIGFATLIDDILQLFNGLDQNHVIVDLQTMSPFVLHLIYKAAAILTSRIQSEVEPESMLRKLRTLREILKLMSRGWLAGGKVAELGWKLY